MEVIYGRLATARFALQTPGGVYIDLLTLRKESSRGTWKIVTKQYSWHRGERWRAR